jgi:hypothetical protein
MKTLLSLSVVLTFMINLSAGTMKTYRAKINKDNALAKLFIEDMTIIEKKYLFQQYSITHRRKLDPNRYATYPQMKNLIAKWNKRPRKTRRVRNIKLRPHKQVIDNTLRQVKNLISYNATKAKNTRNSKLIKQLNPELNANKKIVDQLTELKKKFDKKMAYFK